MIVFRALQGFFGGSMIPTAQTAAVTLFPDKKSAVIAASIVGRHRRTGADAWSGPWRLDYGQLVVAMVILHQHRTRRR